MSQSEEKIDGRTILRLYKNLKNKLDEIENEKKIKFSELDEDIKKKSDVYDELLQKMVVLENNKVNPILQSLNDKIIELEEKQNELINLYQEKLDQNDNEIENTKQEISQLFEEQKELKNEAEALKNEILENKNSSEELFNEIDEYHNELLTNDQSIKTELEKIHKQFINKLNGIDNYYTKLFNYQKRFLDNKISPKEYENLSTEEKEKYLKNNEGMYQEVVQIKSIKELIDKAKKDFEELVKQSESKTNTFFQENNEKFRFLCDVLTKKIDDLLPGATAAGLTSSFEISKNEHKKRIRLWYVAFFAAIAAMCATVYFFILPSLEQVTEFSQAIIQMLKAISINFPLIWLAALANKNIAQSRRLHEEYLHKWAIARSFVMMKNEIEQVDESEEQDLLKQLLKIYLNSTEYNPSKTLDKKIQTENPLAPVMQKVAGEKSDSE